ncbi:hypothetical protein ACQEU3_46795 [Spirillospora sp. CA-253888]
MAEPWAPSLAEVGARIPTRTGSQINPGDDALLGTFTDKTVPTADQVQPIIDDAVASIRHAVGTVTEPLYELATGAAAWRAAADVELAWPARDADIREVYDRLNARATLALKALIDASQDSGTGADATMPVWSFPVAVPWGDDLL